ncbi:MAG: HAMP domain-containing histidine kinase [Bacteroidales bacterium]|nr:HAMP domain-containing histidine kinase [Bacteroidales bacterium]
MYKKTALGISKKQLLVDAEKYLTDAVNYSKQSNVQQNLMFAYGKLSELEEARGNYKKALEYINLNYEIYISIFSQENKNKIATLESRQKLLAKDKEIAIKKLSLQQKQKQQWYYIGVIFLLSIIGGLLFYQSRNRKKINQKLQLLNSELDQANNAKIKFLGILNHDLRSPVSNLIDFLHLQKDSPDLLDDETKNRIEKSTLTSAENLLTSMEDILQWSKSQMENFKPQPRDVFINSVFEDTKNHFSGVKKVNLLFENPDNIQINTDENYLKTILRNLTGNAIKALIDVENPTIIWKAFQKKNKIYLSVTDNGPGANKAQFKALYNDKEVAGIKTGLGLHLIRDLATAIDCEITVDTRVGFGTTILLALEQKSGT